MAEALRLWTRDAKLYYPAGPIAAAAAGRKQSRAQLRRAFFRESQV